MMADRQPGGVFWHRAEAVSRLAQQVGGRMLAYYVTLGEYDFMVVCEMPGHKEASMVVLAAAASSGVTDVKTTLAMTTAEAKEVFAATSKQARLRLPPGWRGQLTRSTLLCHGRR